MSDVTITFAQDDELCGRLRNACRIGGSGWRPEDAWAVVHAALRDFGIDIRITNEPTAPAIPDATGDALERAAESLHYIRVERHRTWSHWSAYGSSSDGCLAHGSTPLAAIEAALAKVEER